MSNDQSVVYVLCGLMTLNALMSKQNFSFYLYKDCSILNQKFRKIEKILMIVLPLVVIFLNSAFSFHSIVIRIWMILIVLLDFALQYLAKECGWLSIDKNKKMSSSIIIWIVFIIAVFFTIKS